ncbi:MAG: CotH kinase family protein [Spirosomaceae bacterium]|jgi:hypothetical protein|nr:CotH kinase family protein [Spirosomataceae bacterium]
MKKALLSLLLISYIAHSQQLTTSNLPIIIIDTKGKVILDEPKVSAEMKIINNGKGKTNKITDKPTDYDGLIGIELRGSSSQMWPKKPYGFELQDAKGNALNASIFGFPPESDFTLFASYNERSLMHAVLAFKLAREIFPYASRTQYIELVLNGQYQGIYVVMERIKRDVNRVNISNLREEDIKGDELTGGYIIKIDKPTGSNLGSWTSQYSNNPMNPAKKSVYFYEAPKSINNFQKAYIKAFMDSVENAIQAPNFTDPRMGYRKFINTSSFVKMMVLNEVTKNIDGYRISSFFYKDKNSKDGRLVCGPPWDYDFSFGMPDYCDGWTTFNFVFENFNTICSNDNWQVPFFWNRLVQDKAFYNELKTEYTFQRIKGALRLERIKAHIDSMATELQEAQVRNFQKWRILGRYDWPTKTFPATWEGEVAEIFPWVEARLNWLDRQWLDVSLIGQITSNEDEIGNTDLKIYPNPVSERFKVEFYSSKAQKVNFLISDELGRTIYTTDKEVNFGLNQIELNAEKMLKSNSINVIHLNIDGKKFSQKVVKQF